MVAPFDADINSKFSKAEIREELSKIRMPFDIAVYGTKNYFNLGAILRIGHNFMTNSYIAIECPDFYAKAAMTARPYEEARIDNVSMDEFFLKYSHRNIVSFERRWGMESKDIRDFQYPENPILLFGSENEGVPDRILAQSFAVVSIPVIGLVTDFNVAVACGIACYDWLSKNSKIG